MAVLHTRYRTSEDKAAGRVSGYSAVFYDPDRTPAQKYVTLRTKDKRVARRRLSELEKRESLGLFDPWRDTAPEYGLTLDEVIERYTKARSDKRERTRKEEEATLRRFQRTLSTAIRLDQVEARHVERYIDAPKPNGEPRSPATRRRYHAVLAVFFKWCVRQGLIEQDPMEWMSPPFVPEKVARYLTDDEADALVRAAEADAVLRGGSARDEDPMWLAAIIRLQLGTGLRIGEAAELRWSAVRLGSKPVIVVGRHSLTKSGHQRVVPLTGDGLDLLVSLAESRVSEADGYVLTGACGGRINEAYASKRIKALAEASGLGGDVTSHTLRHTYGATLASAGASAYHIKQYMGHKSIDTTLRFYGHLDPDRLHNVVDSVPGLASRRSAAPIEA